MYRTGPHGYLSVLLSVRSFEDFDGTARVLAALNQKDASTVAQLKASKAEVKKTRATLVAAQKDARRQKNAMAANAKAVETQLAARKRLLAGLTAEIQALVARRLAAQSSPEQARTMKLLLKQRTAATGGVYLGGKPSSQKAAAAVYYAEKEIGKPYVWAADGPDTFDCSGLMLFAYGKVGVELTHYSGQQIKEGKRVARSNLQPGDLVFFGSPIHHVGMYVGGGAFLEAPYTGQKSESRGFRAAGTTPERAGPRRPVGHRRTVPGSDSGAVGASRGGDAVHGISKSRPRDVHEPVIGCSSACRTMALEMRRARFGRTGSSHSSSPPCVKGPASAEGGPLHVGAVLLGPFGHAAWVPSRFVVAVTSRFPERGYNLLRGQEFRSSVRPGGSVMSAMGSARSSIVSCVAVLATAVLLAALPTAALAAPNAAPPSATTKIVFVHHSTGSAWLQDGYGNLAAVTRGEQLFRLGHQLRLGAGRHRRLDRHRALVDVVPRPLGGDLHDCALRECRDQLQLRAFAREPGWREHHRHVQVLLPQQLCRRQPCRRRAGDRQQPAQGQ